jgi:hypothetical protein
MAKELVRAVKEKSNDDITVYLARVSTISTRPLFSVLKDGGKQWRIKNPPTPPVGGFGRRRWRKGNNYRTTWMVTFSG